MCICAQAYGMFVFNEETRTYWFNATSMEAETEFTLVGQLMGLAIYNSVILDAHFPHCLYLELLGRRPTFQVRPRTHPSFAHARPPLFPKGVWLTFLVHPYTHTPPQLNSACPFLKVCLCLYVHTLLASLSSGTPISCKMLAGGRTFSCARFVFFG